MYASLREYLYELEESGVDGLPLDECLPVTEHVAIPTGVRFDKHTGLGQIRKELGDCQRCELSKTRTNLVFGVGNPGARIVFVGEAPGADEDREGEPFVGAAGQVLTRLISAMGLSRDQVYICNVLKCRPPNNRNPHADEIATCGPFMLKQVKSIAPGAVVALGTFAAQVLLHSKEPISRLRGRFHDFHGIPLMPTFHPSFLLRSQHDKERYWEVWSDMVQVLKKLGLPVPEKKRK